MNTSINVPDLLTTIYVLVDDWYQAHVSMLLKGKPGAKSELSDSEMMTLMLAQDLILYPGKTQFIGFMRANSLSLFPQLVNQSQFNRRARDLRWLTNSRVVTSVGTCWHWNRTPSAKSTSKGWISP